MGALRSQGNNLNGLTKSLLYAMALFARKRCIQMRFICHKCTNDNRYTIWEIFKYDCFKGTKANRKLFCNHCGFRMTDTVAAKIAGITFSSSVILISNLILYKYLVLYKGLYVVKTDYLVLLPIGLALIIILMPLYAYLLCVANNLEYRIRQNRKKNL